MRIERLELSNFRSYNKRTFHFDGLNVLLGPNAVGKTNVLEALYLLTTGTSFRAGLTEEMIHFGADIASVTGIIEHNDETSSLGVILTPGIYLGKRISKRRYLVDGAARTRANFVGRLVSTIFRPEDLRLIEGSPSRRRNFLDDALIQASKEYARALTAYEGALRRRNRILDMLREGQGRREQLAFWDATMIKNGNILTSQRRELLEYLSDQKAAFGTYRFEYDASTISDVRLAQYEMEEVAAGYTLVGPHKDDFRVLSTNDQTPHSKQILNINNQTLKRDLMKYGSRGEQRLAVLFMKLGVMTYLEKKLVVKPVLLLDDIFSELDEVHRREVVRMTEGRQTILTTAEEEVVEMVTGAKIIRI